MSPVQPTTMVSNISDHCTNGDTSTGSNHTTGSKTIWQKLQSIYTENEFVLLIALAIFLAKCNPSIGIKYMYPQITAKYIAVIFIFLLSGLSLQTSELHATAFRNITFNLLIQCYNFFIVSTGVYCICTHIIHQYHIIQNIYLIHGMIICSCLPMAINAVIVVTKSSHGDDAAAIFNSAIGNLMGIFVSPFLILLFLGINSRMNSIDVLTKLVIQVLIPVFIGQLLQSFKFVQLHIVAKYKCVFKNLQQYCLVFIVYTVFCSTFLPHPNLTTSSNALSTRDIIALFISQISLILLNMIIAWYMLGYLFPNQPKLRVMGYNGCSSKTIAVGVPLINAMYATSSPELVALYTLPLLIWHPMQLIIGSLLAPHMANYVDTEHIRLQQEQIAQSSILAPAIPTETTSLLNSQIDVRTNVDKV
jgi:solute carrier family 10 (sodium/bile acid cotransporter), member 7